MTSSPTGFVSALSTTIEIDGDTRPLWRIELQNLVRGFCGALFVALPLLYTMEMWDKGRVLPGWVLVAWMVFGIALCAAFFLFSGFRKERFERSIILDAFTAMGLGILASAITLFVVGRLDFSDDTLLSVRMIALEAVPTAMGASVAISQLGDRGAEARPNPANELQPDLRALLATFLGAILFAFNIAPTVETMEIAYSVNWWHIVAVALFSLLVSWLVVFETRADGLDDTDRAILKGRLVSTLFSYVIALFASYLMLWLFGYLDPSMPLGMQLPTTVILGYAATLGGAAGRIIL